MSRTRVGHANRDSIDVYVGRGEKGRQHIRNTNPGDPGWLGNPYKLDDHSRGSSIRKFASLLETLIGDRPVYRLFLKRLSGKVLGCWCRSLDEHGPACHADVLKAHADRIATEMGDRRCARDEHQMVAYRSWHECALCGVSGQTLSENGRPYDVVGDGAVSLLDGGSS